MKYLAGQKCYLSGPIEHDGGPNWRLEPKKVLTEEFGLNLFDPFDDPKQQWVPKLQKAREERDLETIAEVAKPFVRKDLSTVDESRMLIAYLPYGVPTTGTVHEIIIANELKKPVMLICPQGSHLIPFWYFGFIPLNMMFSSWQEVYAYLREVDAGAHKDKNRWAVIYGMV